MSFVIFSNSSPFLSMNTASKRSQRFHELEKQTIINMDNQGFNSPTIGKALNVRASRIRTFLASKDIQMNLIIQEPLKSGVCFVIEALSLALKPERLV